MQPVALRLYKTRISKSAQISGTEQAKKHLKILPKNSDATGGIVTKYDKECQYL